MSKTRFTRFLVNGNKEAVNPAMEGTKAAAHYTLDVAAGKTEVVRLHLGRARQSERQLRFKPSTMCSPRD